MANSENKVFTLMIEPVKGCNLACRYCYADNHHGGIMTLDVFEQALRALSVYLSSRQFDRIDLIWHGGEPLLAGLDFFRQAAKTLKAFSLATPICSQFVQTNGLLLDAAYCRFFKDENIQVGISLDGPADLHDKFRTTSQGDGTHQRVMDKIALAEQEGFAVGFNAVITPETMKQTGNLYRFFQKRGYDFGVNPLLPSPEQCLYDTDFLNKGEYGRVLCALFDQWISSENERVRVSPIDRYLEAIIKKQPYGCQHAPSCLGAYLAIKPNGDATVCSRFETPLLGNVLQSSVEALFRSPFAEIIRHRPEKLQKCHICENWTICHGGCPHNAIACGASGSSKDPFCHDYKLIFNYLRRHLKDLIPDVV